MFDGVLELFGRSIRASSEFYDYTDRCSKYTFYFENDNKVVTIRLGVFDSGNAYFVMLQGEFSTMELDNINLYEHRHEVGTYDRLEEILFDIQEAIKNFIEPAMVKPESKISRLLRKIFR